VLKYTTLAVAAAALLGTASIAQASDNSSGDYHGGALYGPIRGQVFGLGGRGADVYAGPRMRRGFIDLTESDNSAGHFRYHWGEYLTPQ